MSEHKEQAIGGIAPLDNDKYPAMRDEAAILHLTCTRQGDGTVCYFFGDTTIRVVETHIAGKIRLTPLSGDQVACGEWVDLDEKQVRRYCELLTQYLNSGKPNGIDAEPDRRKTAADKK